MKALTLTQPWASLVNIGSKHVETRGWRTDYRGPLVIHSSARYPAWCRALAREYYFRQGLGCSDPDDLPRGVGLCVVTLLACVKTTEIDKLNILEPQTGFSLAPNEITYGDFQPGRWAWALQLQYPFKTPVPAKGALGLWNWESEVYQP